MSSSLDGVFDDIDGPLADYPLERTRNARAPTAARRLTHTPTISDPTAIPEVTTGERLARRWFSLVQSGDFERLAEMVHDDVQLVSKVKAGAVVEGRADVTQFLHETVATRLYEASGDVYTPLDDARVVVEGRMRWIDEDRVIRDDPVVWAMEFRDRLLLRFVPARTAIEAEAILTRQQ